MRQIPSQPFLDFADGPCQASFGSTTKGLESGARPHWGGRHEPQEDPLVLDTSLQVHHSGWSGGPLTVPSTCPKMVQSFVRQDWQRQIATFAAEKLQMPAGQALVPAVAQRVLSRLAHPQKAALQAYLEKTVWTPQRLSKAGYPVSLECTNCGAAVDNLNHRLFHCPHTRELRDQILSPDTLAVLSDPEQNFPLVLGFQREPDFSVQRPPGMGHFSHTFWSRDPSLQISEAFYGEVFTDGSAVMDGPPQFHTAGWSVVKLDDSGDPLAVLYGPVGAALPCTSQAGEHVAALAVATFCPAVTDIHSDFHSHQLRPSLRTWSIPRATLIQESSFSFGADLPGALVSAS